MTENERATLIEWLWVMTGIEKGFWNKKSDKELSNLYEQNLQKEIEVE